MARFNLAVVSGTLALLAGVATQPAFAREAETPSAAESFKVGTTGSVCEAQGVAMGDARKSIFDRKWVLLCRDIGQPVGTALALRTAGPAEGVAAARADTLDCTGEGGVTLDGIGTVLASNCRVRETGREWRIYSRKRGETLYIVEGLGGYDSALRLAMANLIADKELPGNVQVANLGSNETAGLYRARVGVSDVDTLIGQGYRGNSAGSYAEAAELFAAAPALLAGDGGPNGGSGDAGAHAGQLHELKVNRALQLSNLKAFDQAARLFIEARALAPRDPVQARLGRNFEAIDAVNRGNLASVGPILDRPMPVQIAPSQSEEAVVIDRGTAAGLNAAGGATTSNVLGQATRLAPTERALIIDAQALQLRGTALRLQGKFAEAREPLAKAYTDAMRVRDGRVVSITRLRAQILSETALTYEAEAKFGEAETLLRQAQQLVESQYPDSASVNAARARLAGFLARHGRKPEAIAVYRTIVENVSGNRGALVGMTNLMRPYFDLLAESGDSEQTVSDIFLASQLVERPGAADTLTQLSRQLEGGTDEAAGLFRRSLAITRELERKRVQIAQINSQAESGTVPAGLAELNVQQQRLFAEQIDAMNALAAYPQYRAVANRFITVDELRATLAPGEAYLKLVELAGSYYGIYIAPGSSRTWKLDKGVAAIAASVATLRDSISITINEVRSTYPFDIDTALALHSTLFGPVAGDLAKVHHLVFEPDGALLQLPINLLTGDRDGVAAYHRRVESGGDEYDFTKIAWLGHSTSVSTALSAASFRDARKASPSKATRSYLGLGQNVPLGPVSTLPGDRSGIASTATSGCEWQVDVWNRPIADTELRDASGIFGRQASNVMTGGAFTDDAIMARGDLASYRIIHFATHGLVTAPRDGCPVRPALLTSFGGPKSDGLLGFGEIFNLQIDADLVILSACDTAGGASMEATSEAGVTTGGGQALDGLVRAFIAAGGRQVIASHWPAPDDYGATRRLFTGFFSDTTDDIGDSLRKAQISLMDDADTSHPFYWAGFAIIGDGGRSLTSPALTNPALSKR